MEPIPKKKKIVILGGGVSALTTAFLLTEQADWQSRYDITLYQLGWRLGGKGASGRNLQEGFSYRIEEHGPHVFFGFYDNAFSVMRRCYAEMARPLDAPLATLEQAFLPHDFSILTEEISNQWALWPFWPPRLPGAPGEAKSFAPLHGYVAPLFERLLEPFTGSVLDQEVTCEIPEDLRLAAQALAGGAEGASHPGSLLRGAAARARELATQPGPAASLDDSLSGVLLQSIMELFRLAMGLIWLCHEDEIQSTSDARKIWVFLNFGYGILNGAVECDLFDQGLESINDQDFAQWLGQYVCPDGGLTTTSAVVRWVYDGAFAYPGGDVNSPRLEAGSALLANLRMFLTYSGSVYYKMQSGMGDVVFAPLYLVLAQRGVRFEFFHRVLNLGLSPDQKRVQTITMQLQATVKDGLDYAPLIPIKGLPCWPATPLYGQLVQGEELQAMGIDLESYSPDWPGAGEVEIELAEGDQVVLGISLGALPCVCGELLAASPRWSDMIAAVQTVRTQSFQVWFKPTMSQMGWPDQTKWFLPALTTYALPVNPINSWIDTSQVLPTEAWPALAGSYPQSLGYFCGPLSDGLEVDPCVPDLRLDEVKGNAIDFLEHHFANLLPGVAGTAGEFLWDLLVDNRELPGWGPERFEAQFWISLHNPSDRYVLTVPGSSQLRLRADDGTFENVFPTGDWIYNTFNLGCVEAATMSGMATANALLGRPVWQGIIGWGIGEPGQGT